MLDPEKRENALKETIEVAGVIPNNFARRLKLYHINLRYDTTGDYTVAKRAHELGPYTSKTGADPKKVYKEKPKKVRNEEISVLRKRGYRIVSPAVLMPKNPKFKVEKDSAVMEFLKETGKIVSDGAFNYMSEQASKITSSLNPMVNQIKASAAKAFNESSVVHRMAEGWHNILQDIDEGVQSVIETAAAITIESDWYKTLQSWGARNQGDYPTLADESVKLKLSARKQAKLERFMEVLKEVLDELKDKDKKRNINKNKNYSKDESEDRLIKKDAFFGKSDPVSRNVEPMLDDEKPDALRKDKEESRRVSIDKDAFDKLHKQREESRIPDATESYGISEPVNRNPEVSESHGIGEPTSRIPAVTESYDNDNSRSRNFAKDKAYGERDEQLMQETNEEWKKFLEAAVSKTFETTVTEKFKELISKKRMSGDEAEVAALEEAFYYIIEPLERLTAAKYEEIREISGYTHDEASSDLSEDGKAVESIVDANASAPENTKVVDPLYNERLTLGAEPAPDPNTLNVPQHTEKLRATEEIDLGDEDPNHNNVPSNIEKLEATEDIDLGEEDPSHNNALSNIEKLEATPEADLGDEDPNSLNVRTLEDSGKADNFKREIRDRVAEIERLKEEAAQAEYDRITGKETRNENNEKYQTFDPDKDYADALTLSENGKNIARVNGSDLEDLIIENEDNKILSSLLRYLVNGEYSAEDESTAEANTISSPASKDRMRAREADLLAEYLSISKKRWKAISLMFLERAYSPTEMTKDDIISLMDANESEYDVLNTLSNLFARTTVGQNVLGKITEYTSTSAISKAYYKGVSYLTGKFWDKNKPDADEPSSLITDELDHKFPDLDEDLYRWFNTSDGNMAKHILVSEKRLIPKLIALEAARDQKKAEEQSKKTAEVNGELSYFGAIDKVNEVTQHIHMNQNSDYGIADLATNFRVNKTFVGGEIEYFKSGYHHFFFVKPDLNLTENHIHVMECSGYQRLCDVIPELSYDLKGLEKTWTNGLFPPALSRIDRSMAHPFFSYLISNAIKGLSIPDYTLETKEGYENMFGHRFSFGTTGRKSGYQTDFSISFYDTSDLLLLNIFKVWTKYIEIMYEGQANLLTTPMQQGNLDYLGALYYFVLEPDNHTIVHWGRYTGIYPTNVPWSSIGMSTGSSDLPEFTVNFKCQWHEWNSLEVLQDFNFVMRGAGMYGGAEANGSGNINMADTYFKLGSICKRSTPVLTADPNLIGGATVSENRALVEFVDLLDLKDSKFAPNGSPTLRPYKYVLSFDSATDFSEMTNINKIMESKYNSFYSFVGDQGMLDEKTAITTSDSLGSLSRMENARNEESYAKMVNSAKGNPEPTVEAEGTLTEPSDDFKESENQGVFKDKGGGVESLVDFGYNSANAYFKNGQ